MHIGKEISSHQNSSEIFDNTQDDNGISLVHTRAGSYVTSIQFINKNNHKTNKYINIMCLFIIKEQ